MRSSLPRVLIAGGGFAAVEAMLALRELAGDAIEIQLIAPQRRLAYHPAATAEGFADGPPLTFELAPIAAHAGALVRRDRLEAVAPAARTVRLFSGARCGYDALVLATGARRRAAVPGALTFGDQRDVPHIRRLVDDVAAGSVRRVVFVVPTGGCWPLPAYELALLTAGFAERAGHALEVSIVTPEEAPLGVFGAAASRLVRQLLAERDVRFRGRSVADAVERDGALRLGFGERLRADRVVAVPSLLAGRLAGVPGSWQGFVPTDALGRVEGLDDVYAAGDLTTYPVKHGGIAAQQADRIAATIAARVLGTPAPPPRAELTLRARMIGGSEPLELRATLDGDGRPVDAAIETADADVRASAAAKVFGRYLTPYLTAAHG